MEALINSFFLVFAGEMGDKTQLLALVLAAKYKKPWTILLGIFIATVLNHGLAAWFGDWVSGFFTEKTLTIIISVSFFVFAVWILFPDKEEDLNKKNKFGPLLTTIITFFIAEMGDKTQLATIALGARYSNIYYVTIGTTLGMLASNALVVFLGKHFLQKIPMTWVRRFASVLFFLFGCITLMHFFN